MDCINKATETTSLLPIKLMLALTLIIFLINIDYTAINLAVPSMSAEFNGSIDQVAWVLTAYTLTWAILILPCGRLSTKYTNRQLCIWGLSLFIVASMLATLAPSVSMLVLSRVLQGIAAAIYTPSVYGMIYCNIPESVRGKAIGILSLGVGTGLAFGPLIGGAFVDAWSWRGIFLINIPIGLLALFVIRQEKDNEQRQGVSASLHKTSIVLFATAMVTLIITLNQWQQWSSASWLYFGMALLSCTLLKKFISLQQTITNPLVPLTLFKGKKYIMCCIGSMVQQGSFAMVTIGTSLYLQHTLGFSTLNSSFVFLFLTVVFGFIAMLGGAVVDKHDIFKPLTFGLVALGLGAFLFGFTATIIEHSLLWLFFVLFIIGFGIGLTFVSVNTGLVKTVSPREVGIATSIFMVLSLIGNIIGIVIAMFFYQYTHSVCLLMLFVSALCLFTATYFTLLTMVKPASELHIKNSLE